ncbi:MAG: signal peptide peptidase SppA [Nitrospinaceae bacterium]|nr:MAG: signal peptide peptidase SppA [Nitrospinaceae bacterium]
MGKFIKLGCKVAILFGFWLTASGCATFNFGPSIEPLKEKTVLGKGSDKVLLVDIQGLISNKEKRAFTGFPIEIGMVERVREILRKAEKDKNLKALLLRINSPGGTVTSSDIIYHEIKAFKARKKIKVYVSIVDLAASGGYYIAMAGDSIMGHPTSLTGSIGVIAVKINVEGLMSKIGVDWEVVKSGDKKDFLSPLRPLTDEEMKLFQLTIDSFHNRFVAVIAENRPELGLSKIKPLADGRVYNAEQALEAKLIDHIGYLDDSLDLIKKELGLSEVKVVTYLRPGDYKPTLYSSIPASPTLNLLNIDLGLNLDRTSPHFMYLWMP